MIDPRWDVRLDVAVTDPTSDQVLVVAEWLATRGGRVTTTDDGLQLALTVTAPDAVVALAHASAVVAPALAGVELDHDGLAGIAVSAARPVGVDAPEPVSELQG